MRSEMRISCLCAIAATIFGYFLSTRYVGTHIFQIRREVIYTYEATNTNEMRGVTINPWFIPTNTTASHCLAFPILVYYRSEGPFTTGFALNDKDSSASSFLIKYAVIEAADGKKVHLTLMSAWVPEPDSWHPFHRNVAEWIGHVYHEGDDLHLGRLVPPLRMTARIVLRKNGVEEEQTLMWPLQATTRQNEYNWMP